MKQLNLFIEKVRVVHGGSLGKGKRKTARPLDTKRPIHLILKTSNPTLLLEYRELVEETNRKFCEKFGITAYKIIVHEDHIHIVLTISNRNLYTRWIRSLTGVLVRKIKGLSWEEIPYTRVATWGRDFKNLMNYLDDNQKEVEFISWAHEYVKLSQVALIEEIDQDLKQRGLIAVSI